MLSSAGRMDVVEVGKPFFQIRDPSRDGKAKMLCTIKADEFGWTGTDEAHLTQHALGIPVPNKQKVRRSPPPLRPPAAAAARAPRCLSPRCPRGRCTRWTATARVGPSRRRT